jgi:hypothetical protein
VNYHLDMKDTLLTQALEEGAKLAGEVDIHDPKGVPRNLATRVAKCSGGIIAERIFNDFFNRELVNRAKTQKHLSKIELFVPSADHSKGQVDFVIRSRIDKKTILTGETRSSFSYITESIENVVRYASLLGPYVTIIKPSEETKDIHVTVIHRVDPAELLKTLKVAGIDSYIVGGGTKQMFNDANLRTKDDLYQKGAEYLIIKPMWKGLDAFSVIDTISAKCLEYFNR